MKKIYEKMVDYKRFAITLLAVGVFFYLGVIIPTDTKSTFDLYIMMSASTILLALSIIFFFFTKKYRKLLLENEEGENLLNKRR